MAAKEMEGDNQRRRTLAREARRADRLPSEQGVTLGASKQPEHLDRKRRDGPAPAGRHKPGPGAWQVRVRATPVQEWPREPGPEPGPDEGAGPRLRYRELVTALGALTLQDFDTARRTMCAVVGVTVRTLGVPDGKQLLMDLPGQLHDPDALWGPPEPEIPFFLAEVGRLLERRPEQVRIPVQAVFTVLRDAGVEVSLPAGLGDLAAPLPPDTPSGPEGRARAVGEAELAAALRELPYWSGDRRSIHRDIALPPDSLDRVLPRLERLREDAGRSPHIARPDRGTATLTLYTTSAGAVTAADIALAHRVDVALDQAGGGMAG